jgi:phosphoglycerol transferase MdoB-like AlkP superfamily enzyme
MLIDLPIMLLYSAHRDLINSRIEKFSAFGRIKEALTSTISRKKVLISSAVILAFFMLVLPFYPEFQAKYLSNELFCYHVYDAVDALFISSRPREVDKSLYTSPDYSDAEYYGIAEGKNVIVIQVEALQNFVIGQSYEGQEITPTLNSLIGADSFYFDNYYYQIGGGNTADAEFTVNNSLFAPDAEAAYIKYTDNTYYGLPYILKDNGYSGAHAYHNYKGAFWNRELAYPLQGFDSFTSLEDMEETDMFPLGLSDREMFRQTVTSLSEYEEPFYAFYVTVSSHHPYAIPDKDIAITLSPEDEGTIFGQYLQAINYVDRVLGEFIGMLKNAGLYENSVLVIYGDHYALTNTDEEIYRQVSELTGEDYAIFDVFNVPMIINIPGSDVSKTVHTAGGHVDVMPTLLYLLGITNDRSVMFGQNLIEADVGLVPEQAHVAIGSFISDDLFFRKPYNNIKSNYDAYDKATMEKLDPDLFSELSRLAEKRIRDCTALLDENDLMLK